MSDIVMTMDAVQFVGIVPMRYANLTREFAVAENAVLVQNAGIARPDADGFMKVLQRKCLGVMIPVFGFREIFTQEIVRHVAVVAGGVSMVAGFLPPVVLLAHNMTIHARPRIVR